MRTPLVALFLMAALAAGAHNLSRRLDRFIISGSEYVSIASWAGDAGFEMSWNRKDSVVSLANPSSRVEFSIDSRRAEIDGVNVWLSLPVVNRNGMALLSVIDLSKTLDPILFPVKSENHLKLICLDPGHGGKDSGKAEGSNYEKTYTLLLARDVAELLRHEGMKVVLTRDFDETVDVHERPAFARRRGADLFVSMHFNANPDPGVRGLEVYCMTPAGMNSSNDGGGKAPRSPEGGNEYDDRNVLLAYDMQKDITRSLPIEDRGMKRSRFEVLREAGMPAILIEGGFISNRADARNIYDSKFRKRLAQAIVDGITSYRKTVEPLYGKLESAR